jgi:hypothetical protein
LGSVVYACRRFSKHVPLKKIASFQNFFIYFCRILIFQRGLISCRTKSCEVVYPTDHDPAGYKDPTELSLAGIRSHRTMAELCTFYSRRFFCGSDTLQNTVLWGLIVHLTKFCRVSDPMEQSLVGYQTPWKQLLTQIYLRIRNRIQKCFRFVEKTEVKIPCYYPL